uniref:Uncharacterized protein n=1 Tax=Romanomermis culicivorax TaxID=13658 RepID=A0A915JBJ4_ROMCU
MEAARENRRRKCEGDDDYDLYERLLLLTSMEDQQISSSRFNFSIISLFALLNAVLELDLSSKASPSFGHRKSRSLDLLTIV